MDLEMENNREFSKIEDFEILIEKMEDENGNFQLSGSKTNFFGELAEVNIICIGNSNSKYINKELSDLNEIASQYFPQNYSYSKINEYSIIKSLENDDAFFEFKLLKK